MALTVPDVARFTIHGVWTNGHSCDTVLDMQLDTTGSVLTREAALQDLADDVIQNWQSQIMHQLPNNYTVLGIHFIDLDEEDGATGDRPIDAGETATGLLTDPACPPNVAVLVKKLTTSGRGSRSGRMYLPGIEEANVSEDGVIGNSTIDALQAACDDFLDNINNDSGGPIDWTSRLVVVHLEPRPAPPLPDNRVGTYTAVSSLAVQSTVATQRRRLR